MTRRRAPLLCAGLIGWRSLELAGRGAQDRPLRLRRRGPYHRPGLPLAGPDGLCLHAAPATRRPRACPLARRGWAGGSDEAPPEPLDAAIIFAPVGALVPLALRAVRKGGRVVCGGIHMSDIPAFPYRVLWEERQILSVANLTREDAVEFLAVAPKAGVRTTTNVYPLDRANEALADLRDGRIQGAAVLVPAGAHPIAATAKTAVPSSGLSKPRGLVAPGGWCLYVPV